MARVICNDKILRRTQNRMRPIGELRRRLNSGFRRRSSSKANKTRRNRLKNKGKEKMVEMEMEMEVPMGHLVCGICLSGEGERKVRGTLDCCNHYFCFACIMEWSKVESRCPICKQRYKTISKTPIGFTLRKAEIAVPKRDQVYQPSEEELMNYVDVYENVFCKECYQGGDDELVLLCDLCDTAAHTYCVGLGREVPAGNWYCDTCKQTDLSSSNAQSLNHGAPDNISVGSTSVAAVRETFDNNDNTNYVPETLSSQLAGHSSPKTHSNGNSEDISSYPVSMAGALSERQQTQSQIHQSLNDRCDQIDGIINLPGSQIREDALVSPQQASTQVGTPPQSIFDQGRLPDHDTPLNNTVVPSSKLSSLGERGFGNQASTSASQTKDGCQNSIGKEQMQQMVKHHLKSLSRKMGLGYDTFKEIARTSTHTVLAAVGLEHRPREVYQVRTQPVKCTHLEESTNRVTCLNRVQCSSCFDRFVRNVVKEVLSFRVPDSSTKQTFQKQ